MTGEMYFGAPGGLVQIQHPRDGIQTTRVRQASTFQTASGGARVGKSISGKRRYTLNWAQLFYSDFATLQAYDQGHNGPGPFVLHDPGQVNWLTVNQSSATSLDNDTDGFTLDPGSTALANDNFTRTVTGGWGTATSGQTWSNNVGTAAWFSTNGTQGLHTHTAGGPGNLMVSLLSGTLTDVDVVVTADTSSILSLSEAEIFVRYTDVNNWYRLMIDFQLGKIRISKTVAGVDTELDQATIMAATSSPVKLRFSVDGTTLRGKAWLATDTEPVSWQVSGTASDLASGGVALGTYDEGSAKTVSFDDLTINYPSGPSVLSSSATLVQRGPRALAWTHNHAPISAPTLTLDSPSADWPGIPVIANQAIMFSCSAQGAGTDAIVTLTPKLVWLDSAGATISTTSGTPVVTASGSWATVSVTGTPPATAYYVLCKIEATSGASLGSITYLDQFQLERGSAVTTWRPGTGIIPVAVVSVNEQWPWMASDYRQSPVMVLQEVGP